MGYNSKNDQSRQLVSEFAPLTGTEVASMGTKALPDRFEREHRVRSSEKRLQEMRAIADRCARLLVPGPPAIKHGDKLYDDQGLPR
ncbi:MAG: type II toxin-antitoxin system VapB family antitoxin [Gammaproteobacteria bacterium]|nr:type II toxin-antitoxin system VapB family antitoxin [Gammaproteobacteria bacterium]MDE0269777.1 type II toxin-antitoxin system VapB family antitoxin [Gammaproteobacteria bacterium]